MLYDNDQAVKYTKSSKFGLYKYYYYDNDCYQPDRKIYTYILIAAILLIISFMIILIIYLCRPKLNSIDLMTEKISTYNDTVSITTEILINISDTSDFINMTTDSIEDRSIFLENLTSESEFKTVTAMPFLFDWFTPKYVEPQSEPRKNNRILLKKNENIPRPFYQIKDPASTSFYSVNRNTFNPEPNRPKVNNIQDIIKYLETQNVSTKTDHKPIKLTGSYTQPKLDTKTTLNSPIRNTKKPNYARLMDPFYHYKPQNPGDINLLAPNTYRFSPFLSSGYLTTEKYPVYEQVSSEDNIKPVSLLLDIYPMTDTQNEGKPHVDHNDVYETTTYIPFGTKITPKIPNKNNMNYRPPNKMVFHLNLYPRSRTAPQMKSPYFLNRRRISTKRPSYYKPSYLPYTGKLLQNEEYIRNKEYNLDRSKLNLHKYITRNLTEPLRINENIHPVSEPNSEITELDQNVYSNQEIKRQDNNPNIITDTKYRKENKLTGNSTNYDQLSQKEELQKILFSTLPPHIIHNKYYTTSPPDRIDLEWSSTDLEKNPNLINHKNSSEINKK